MKKSIVLVLGLLILSSCTSIGPFVTNLSSDGSGNLVVEKCRLKINSFLSTVSVEECRPEQIKVK